MPFGKIAGLAVGIFVAHYFILPQGILHTLYSRPIPMTDLLRLFAALIITIVAMALGHFFDKR